LRYFGAKRITPFVSDTSWKPAKIGPSNSDFSPRVWKGGALRAAEKPYDAVILSPFAVVLSAAKNLALPLRVNCAKDLALSIFKAMQDSSSPLLLRMTALLGFSAACKAVPPAASSRGEKSGVKPTPCSSDGSMGR